MTGATREGAPEIGLDGLEQRQAVSGRLVAGVVDEARVAVEGGQVATRALGQEPERDGKVLVAGLSQDGVRGREARRVYRRREAPASAISVMRRSPA